ncbi:MAG: HAD-IIB family hydrolase, partial [Thermostichus sp. BF3_bins_97]
LRGQQLELGRDADTGGQTRYVLDLVRALSQQPQVERVDLVTRQVVDGKVSPDYAQPWEPLTDKAQIVRLPFGPRRYLRKEVLWPHLDALVDELLRYLRRLGRLPDAIHAHYADAGYVGTRLAAWLGIPLIYTGHSLGRVKRQRLLQQGQRSEVIEEQFHLQRRIAAEEATLTSAALVITSTRQEIEEQYSLYQQYHPQRMRVIPPGIHLERFHPQPRSGRPPVADSLERFLRDPRKPFILALSRASSRKNVAALVRAYGEDPHLQTLANLVLILGNRGDIRELETESRQVMTELLLLIDQYDLYGRVAYPKSNRPEDVPDLYRLAARQRGIFVNPALTEPFGLTLLEAAACGLPIVATQDGGPRDILAACGNGLLVDPFDLGAIQTGLKTALKDPNQWQQWSRNGLQGVRKHYAWPSHVKHYVGQVRPLLKQAPLTLPTALRNLPLPDSPKRPLPRQTPAGIPSRNRIPLHRRLLIADIDGTLIGDREGLQQLLLALNKANPTVGLGIATGRCLESALEVLREWEVPMPELLITSVGGEIHYGPQLTLDQSWQDFISPNWQPEALRTAMGQLPGLKPQIPMTDRPLNKVGYILDPAQAPKPRQILQHLKQQQLSARAIFCHQRYLDLLPQRASKGDAVQFFARKWGYALTDILVAGDSGNDESMLTCGTLAMVVRNYSPELEKLRRGYRPIYFAQQSHAWGILEALHHFDWLA